MIPFRKKKTIPLGHGRGLEIEFITKWNKFKDEVIITTKEGPIVLNGKSELYINVSAENADPIKIQIIPDFKNRELSFIEVIDIKANKKFLNTGPKIVFKGITVNRPSLSDILQSWDESIQDIEKAVKKYRRTRNIFVPINILLSIWSLYAFTTKTGIYKYFNLAAACLAGLFALYIWSWDRKINKNYTRFKQLKENIFGIVKEE